MKKDKGKEYENTIGIFCMIGAIVNIILCIYLHDFSSIAGWFVALIFTALWWAKTTTTDVN